MRSALRFMFAASMRPATCRNAQPRGAILNNGEPATRVEPSAYRVRPNLRDIKGAFEQMAAVDLSTVANIATALTVLTLSFSD